MSASCFDDTDVGPPTFSGLLTRSALLGALAASARKVCLIQAPPGYGKTALLSQIYQYDPTHSLWITLRQADNDPARLLYKLGTRLQRLASASPLLSTSFLDGFAPGAMTPWKASFIDALNAHAPLQVCLDDADLLTATESLEILDLLIRHSAPHIRVFITCTAEPAFSYAHLLLEQQLLVLDQAALKFTLADTRALFSLHQAEVPPDSLLEALESLSEGWPTAIRFAVQTCTDPASLQEFITALTADSLAGPLAFERYFFERVYERQAPALRRLLLRLSLTEEFTAEICRRLSESDPDHPAANTRLPDLIRQQWFVTPLDRDGRWLRFHRLFSLFLRKRAQWELIDSDIREARLTVAGWLQESGRGEEAIALALQAGAFDKAAQAMEAMLPTTVIRQGRHQTFVQWFKHLPETIIRQYPRVRLGYIVSLSLGRHYLAAAEQIALLNHSRDEYAVATRHELDRTLALIFCCTLALQDDAQKVEPEINRWLAQWNDIRHYPQIHDYHYELGFAWLVKGFSAKCASDFVTAKDALKRAHDHFEAYGSPWGQAWVRAMIAVNAARQGFHYEALREAMAAHAFAQQHLGEPSHPGCGLAVLMAAIYYETDELALAEHYQRDALEYLKEQSATDLLVAGFETRARLLMHAGKREEGLGFLKDGIQWAEAQSLKRLQWRLADELIVWLLRQGRAAEAERYASHFDLLQRRADAFDMTLARHHATARCRVYLMLARKQHDEALRLLEALAQRSERLQHQRRAAEWYKLMAMVHEKCKRYDAATQALDKALHIASLQQYFRLFIDDAPALRETLTRVGNTYPAQPWGRFHQRLLQKIQPPPTQRTMQEALTTKELEILQFLQKGLSNKQMASLLFVSEGTLKWHLHNIYSKLDVKNRTQALLAASQAGYLQVPAHPAQNDVTPPGRND